MKFFTIFTASVLFSLINGEGFFWPDVPSTPEKVLEETVMGDSSGQQCSDQQLLHCQVSFNNYLGIPGKLDWKVPLDFHFALLKIYQQNGTQGFLKVCQAYTLFSQCLGPMYAACNNPLFYLAHGYSILSATYYPAVIAQLHFQCGGGLETAINNWNCIQRVGSKYNMTILSCNTAYAVNASVDPAHACVYANNDMQCTRAPFSQNCNAETSWYMCEYIQVGLSVHLPMCNLRCRVGGSSEPEDVGQKLSELEDQKVVDQGQKHPLSPGEQLGKEQLEVYQQIARASMEAKKEEIKAGKN